MKPTEKQYESNILLFHNDNNNNHNHNQGRNDQFVARNMPTYVPETMLAVMLFRILKVM